jgi:hypothetical protein
MSDAEARTWYGEQASYSPSASFRGNECRTPIYRAAVVTASDFQLQYRVTLTALGINADSVRIVDISCNGKWTVPGSSLIHASSDRVLTVWDGVFFVLTRS